MVYGNDGNHYNDSINRPPNNVVSQLVANALHYSSDHIPIIATLQFEPQNHIMQSTINISDGWNLLSVPLSASDMTTSELFPTAISPFYDFNSTYFQVSTLENGRGYWAKFLGDQNQIITGTVLSTNDIEVSHGWNLVGPFDNEVNVEDLITIPPNILVSSFFGYDGAYVNSMILKPGKGYWVKVSNSGIIRLNTN
jgi:hypothetical protein